MFIAVAADGKSLKSQVSDNFVSCKYLLIINMNTMIINAIENSGDPKGEDFARKIVNDDCEAVITGKLTPEAFDIIADNDITRYDGHGYSAEAALALMDRHALKLIKNTEGTDDCDSHHTEASCDGHDD